MRKTKVKAVEPVEAINLRGCLEWELRNAYTGEVLRKGKGKNTITYAGRSWALRKIAQDSMASGDIVSSLALGTVSTGGATANTALAGYFTYASVAGALTTAATTSPYVQFTCSYASSDISATGYNSIWEMALYNSTGSAGTAFSRYIVTGTCINATSSNELYLTYTVSN